MNIDLITMLGNLSQSLFPLQRFITGGAYLLGIVFFMTAVVKLKAISANRSSQEKTFVPLMYLMFGAGLLYLPSTLSSLANTAFGVGNVLTYSNYNPYDIFSSMGLIIRTAGLVWFVRGSVLLAHASQPGVQEGPKGLLFLIAGVFAINFDNTVAMFNYFMGQIVTMAITFKQSQGY